MTQDRPNTYTDRIVADVRALSAQSPGGRLPMPDLAEWDIFPFEGEMQVRELSAPSLPESPRHGEDGADACSSCKRSDDEFIWTNDNWRLNADEPSGLPATVMLTPRVHCDLTDLPQKLAVEMGPLFLRIEAALLSLGGIARVHINRWGDGGAHLHWWFIARPEGLTQLMGSCSSMWLDVLPPRPQNEWDDTMRRVASAMTDGD